ncbi:hypothetical protein [Halomarina halobia]
MEGAELLSHIKACSGTETDVPTESTSGLQSRLRTKRRSRTATATREEGHDLHGEIRRLKLRIAALERERSVHRLADRPIHAAHTHLQACDMCGTVTHAFDPDGVHDCPECKRGILRAV